MSKMTLFELTNLIKLELENNLEPNYWVIGEISELRVNQKGHCYMELVEKENNFIQAKIRANIWSYTYRTVSSLFESATGTPLKAGIKVLFNISINFHEVYGMSATVNDLDPNYTIGERSRLRELTIKKLNDAGLTEKNKQLSLPEVPQRIAIISSDSAAGYGDFMNQLSENLRGYHFHTVLFTALMQGNESVVSIRKALKAIHESDSQFDAVVLIRGGGAQADLDSFDTFELARAIALFPLPVLVGIGHERDQTVVDIVAHTSLKTPTAVAEFLLSGMERFNEILHEHIYRIERVFEQKLSLEQHRLLQLSHEVEQGAFRSLKSQEHQLKEKSLALTYTIKRFFEKQLSQLIGLEKQVDLINPETIFKRGYSITLKNGKSIAHQKVALGDELETRTLKKNLKSTVTAIENE